MNKKFKAPAILFMFCVLISGCANVDELGQNSEAAESLSVQEQTTTSLNSKRFMPLEDASAVKVQLSITTSSDFSALRLIESADWHEPQVISTSNNVEFAGIEEDAILIKQPLNQAQSGTEVELVVEFALSGMKPGGDVLFEIERGHAGSSQVKISKIIDGVTAEITTLSWSGTKMNVRNAQTYEVSTDAFLGSEPNEHIVIGQLNLWYFGPGPSGGFEDEEGNRTTPLNPLLGDYWSDNPDVIEQQIEWAVEYGVDAFSIEWDAPIDECLGYPMEKTMDEVFLVAPNLHKMRWLIFYDFNLRLFYYEDQGVDINKGPNFDQQIVHDTFVNDFVHFATKYFDHPQYLTIDGRPVVYIWATYSFTGDFASAIEEARQRVAELGYDVYIVGDAVCYRCFNVAHASLFDATSTFTFLIPGVDQNSLKDVGDAVKTTDVAFTWWRDKLTNLKVIGRDESVNFQSGWAPQYDERASIEDNPKYVLADSKEQVQEMAEVARTHAEPTGKNDMKLIWLNTWNCWGETTTVEPTMNLGPKYPGGNYQFDMLEVVRDVFGAETFYTSP